MSLAFRQVADGSANPYSLRVPEPNRSVPADSPARLRQLAEDWRDTTAQERSAFQTWLIRFCEALGAEPPDPPTDDYQFELPVHVVDREGRESTNFIDCWKAGHFAMEAKASGSDARNDTLLRRAFGQVRNYVAHVPGDAPPYLMVVDVPRTLIVWDRWSGQYGDFAAGRRIALASLHERPDDIALLYDIFEQPWVRDPRGRAQAVTKEIAAGLGELAARLEDRGLDNERVARFLMRCVFSCFAEDVGLLPDKLFRQTLEQAKAAGNATVLELALTSLWKTMDTGGMFGAQLLHRFNGHFFKTVEALPLEAGDVDLLIDAAKYDWSKVEPSIFGTLLVRALDPEERHRLGAEYTPRAYIERLVEPTVVEPIRERWTAVQGAMLQLEQSGKKKDITAAVKQLRDFHEWMRGLSFLDPACGSGNFLYVTMIAVKRIEQEVLKEIERLSGGQGGLVLDEVHPRQFHGIEVKPWAREIAELTLWIGYHQFWRDTHGGRTPPDPILEDTGTIECRDAVLAWDEIVRRPEGDRPDPTPRVRHPVTGELVPDPEARLPYYEYVGARQAEWPKADFIVGNPPYIGGKKIRQTLGDGYTDALQSVYSALPDAADFVMYWWSRAAHLVAGGEVVRAGLITTNSLRQKHNRPVVRRALAEDANIIWAIADHEWSGETDDAAVRVSMTVMGRPRAHAIIGVQQNDGAFAEHRVARINPDLTGGVDLADMLESPLRANDGLCFFGFLINGPGFLIDRAEFERLIAADVRNASVLKPIIGGQDVTRRPADEYVIDFGEQSLQEARDFPLLYNIVLDRVKPARDANRDRGIRENWWRFHRIRQDLRQAMAGLGRVAVTVETMKHRFFTFLTTTTAPDHSLVCIAVDDGSVLGVLSSVIHVTWALAAGGRLGFGNDPRYNRTVCFDPFPFPLPHAPLRARIAALAERLDAHRKAAIARDERVTMTGMYNVVEKLRSGEPLTPKERAIHEIAACGVLRDLHDELDALVAEAYGWPWPMEKEEILERLVALHDERVAEEKRGVVRWLRPDYQIPRFGADLPAATLDLGAAAEAKAAPIAERRPWPKSAVEQLAALGALVAQRRVTVEEAAASFDGAKRELVARHLETLAMMGEVTVDAGGRYEAARKVA